jgi:hypothetical protein
MLFHLNGKKANNDKQVYSQMKWSGKETVTTRNVDRVIERYRKEEEEGLPSTDSRRTGNNEKEVKKGEDCSVCCC